MRHRRDFDKVAIVGAPTWERWCATLANLLITGEIKAFTRWPGVREQGGLLWVGAGVLALGAYGFVAVILYVPRAT